MSSAPLPESVAKMLLPRPALHAGAQTKQPGEIGHNVSQDREHAKENLAGQARLFGADVSGQHGTCAQPGQREILALHW
ncbi:MAG TPA: hypothetical protein VGF67_22035 [Ktedonobacteraceae bacterium]